MQITKGFKYRIYPNKEQQKIINHQCFIYNQAYNICLNLQQEQWNKNKDLDKKDRIYLKASEIDTKVKLALKQRELSYKSVVTQQARINANRALEQALKDKNKGFPKFKNSKITKQSFNWNNQGYQIKEHSNPKFKIFRLMNTPLKMRYHRELPKEYKLNQITITKNHNKFYIALSITYHSNTRELNAKEIQSCIGIDMNINDIALSNGTLIDTNSKLFSVEKYDKAFKRLQRKQSRRILKSKTQKIKLSNNFKKTQQKLNTIYERSSNVKKDSYHKITSRLIQEFDLIAVEDLQTKNMTKRAKLKNVKAKSGLNKSILNTSFYQFSQYLEYKAKHNGKFFVKINPQNTSKTCSICGHIKENLTLKDRTYFCENCGNTLHRDINAANNILKRGLESFGLGISLENYKLKAFQIS
ncbi:RNA-guided endonuclease InsQ/TnpB family protein [Campylobacter coli]